ncbi:hypothetical protein OTU49_015838, partial [Cherax quadricarinatus]
MKNLNSLFLTQSNLNFTPTWYLKYLFKEEMMWELVCQPHRLLYCYTKSIDPKQELLLNVRCDRTHCFPNSTFLGDSQCHFWHKVTLHHVALHFFFLHINF